MEALLALQRSAGNHAVAQLLRARDAESGQSVAAGQTAESVRVAEDEVSEFDRTAPSPARRAGTHPVGRSATHPTSSATSSDRVTPQVGRPSVVQRFEAQHHEHVERAALTAPTVAGGSGFTDAEASATYFGNWSRDMSQVLGGNPLVKVLGAELVFEIVNAMAVQKFGRTLDPTDFGVYSPREHIDNPAGQVNADLIRRDMNVRIHGAQVGTDEDIGGGGDQSKRTDRLRERVDAQFAVNAEGLPAYLGRSIQYVEEELSTAADLGRSDEDAFMHLGNGLHTVEDLFAHSNFVEIAAGKLFRAGRLPLPPDVRTQLEGRRCEDPSHADRGQPLDAIDTFSGTTDTGRPILVTGSFVTADTKISIAEALAAFLAELSPFGAAGNQERSQQVVRTLLGRYEELARTGEAGDMIATAVGNIGGELAGKLAEAAEKSIAGEQPAENAGFWDRAAAGLRSAAGAVVGTGLRALGSVLSWDWVTQSVSAAVNQFGRLPLLRVYEFVVKQTNTIDGFFEGVDQRLRAFPFYLNTVKPWLDRSLDSLRESLKSVIEGALKFMAQLLQSGFVEQQVQNTNIAQQIQSQINSEIKNPASMKDFRDAKGPEDQIAKLMDPKWCATARIDVIEAERIASMMMAPDYIKAAASHSQIAKDHADSPFFGTAAALASFADTRLRDLMIMVWSAEGSNHSTLADNYGDESARVDPYYAARRPPPGKQKSEWTQDERIAERHAQADMPHYGELKRRQEGEELRETGAFTEAEEDHGGEAGYAAVAGTLTALSREAAALPDQLADLADGVSEAAPTAARRLREIAQAFPAGIRELAEEISAVSDHEEAEKLADRVRTLAEEKDGLVVEIQQVLNDAASQVAASGPAMDAAATRLRVAATTITPAMRVVARRLAAAAAKLTPKEHLMGEEQRKKLHTMAPVATSAWAPEFAASGAQGQGGGAMSPERAALFDFVRTIFNHPYDTDWYEPTLIAWCEANQERLAAYIAARNRGEMHHHPH
ncbi:HET-C-related protein [Actinopolymorpha pittospori]